jgi:arabinosyltransferase
VQALRLGVVVPQFMAGQDRWWAPHNGRLPGAPTPLPYRAPADHVLDLERSLGKQVDENEFGFNVPFREYSFLQNPRMPERVRDSVLTIEPCGGEDVVGGVGGGAQGGDCADGSRAADVRGAAVRLQRNLTDAQLRAALGPLAERYSVLHFRGMAGMFGGHERGSDRLRFERRVRLLGSLWCCVKPEVGKPGHVWYDAQWDVVPHTDLHNRKWDEPWHIVTGP